MTRRRLFFVLSIVPLLACNFVTQMMLPPTPTQAPTAIPSATASSTPTPPPLQPAYIPPECAAFPLATLPFDLALEPTFDPELRDVSQAEQLDILRDLSDVIEATYVYPDYNGRDWQEIKSRYRDRIETGLDTPSFYDEMSAMVQELGDEHSFFLSPAEVQETEAELRGDIEFVGVGIYGQPDLDRGRLIVISTYPGSPADHAGIRHHDSILLVDGQSIDENFSDRLRGPRCSAVVLQVQSPGGMPREVVLVRAPIGGNIPIEARRVDTRDRSKIGYIFLPSFFDETLPGQIENALHEFGYLDGLILDLRMNGGGSSSVAYPILEYFTDGTLGEFVGRSSSRALEIRANEIQNSQTVPLIILISRETASFGEIFAGVLQGAGRARIVGETSPGNVEVLHGYDFEDGSQVWIAAETFVSAFSSANWEETGIVPDVHAIAGWDTFYFETDPSLAAAIRLLGHE